MKCLKCGSETTQTVITEIVELEEGVLIINNVPCYKCNNCGKEIFAADVAVDINRFKENTRNLYQDITIIDYNKASQKYTWGYVI